MLMASFAKGPALRVLCREFRTYLEAVMWKIGVGFVVFAGLAMFVIMKGGDNLDMGGEKHGAEAVHAPAPDAPAK
jgi:hypothetical protein